MKLIQKYSMSCVLLATALAALLVTIRNGLGYTQGAYIGTLIGGSSLSIICGMIAHKLRNKSESFLFWQMFWFSVFFLSFTLEEIGWFIWRSYGKYYLFEFTLSPFLKSIQGASGVAAVSVIASFVYLGKTEAHSNWSKVCFSISLLLFIVAAALNA